MEQGLAGEQRRISRVEQFQAFTYCLARSRFSVIILVVGLALLLSDQGQDLLIAYAEDGKTMRLSFAAAIWALSIWGWCRLLLDIRYEGSPRDFVSYNRWRTWLPRILGTLAFVVLALASWRAGQVWLVAWAVAGLAVFLYFVIKRRAIGNAVAKRLGSARAVTLNRLAPAFVSPFHDRYQPPPYGSLREALHLPPAGMLWQQSWGFRGVAAASVLALFVFFCIASTLVPVYLSVGGPMLLFFLSAAAWLPVGCAASYATDRHGVPVLTVLVVIAAVSSLNNDNHEIPSVSGITAPAQRPTLANALTAWADANHNDGAPRPLVIVASAGGGIRAAYWTGTVLGELDREAAGFRNRLFAISGVSGGSVGATVFRALADLPPDQLRQRCPGGITECAQKILAADSLTPLAAAMVYSDLGQRFFPFPLLPDRAAALEHAWEVSFRYVTGQDSLTSSLADLSRRKPWPALFLNATWSDIGRRLVASNIRHGSTLATLPDPGVRYSDQLAVIGHDLRLSTAAHNSARFPYVSPAGMWRNADGKIAGRLQDGGLFENYGAETALDILDVACNTLDCVPPAAAKPHAGAGKPVVTPIVVLITSDPSLPANLAEIPAYRSSSFAAEVRTTPMTYEHVRSARGIEAALRLQEWGRSHGDNVVVFRMCEKSGEGVSPPLGWFLSCAGRRRIDSFLLKPGEQSEESMNCPVEKQPPSCYADNQAALRRIVALLARPGG